MKYSKHKNAKRAKLIDEMMMNWADPKMVAGSLEIALNSSMRYIHALGYQRCYITDDERQLITLHRLSKLSPTK